MKTTTRTRTASRWFRLAAVGALVVAASAAYAGVDDPFTADFNVNRGKLSLGTTTFSLRAAEQPGCHVYTGRANPNALVRLFIGNVTDESRFCIDDDNLRPQYFRHHIAGNAEDSYTLDFDWTQQEVIYKSEAGEDKTIALSERALDPLSIQIAARRWVAAADDPDALGEAEFPLVDEDETKTYRLRARDGGTIDTPGGRFDTLLVERVDDDKRRLRFWLARDADWIPVQVEREKKGDGVFRMTLTRLQRAGQ